MMKYLAAFIAAALLHLTRASDRFAEGSASRESMKIKGHVAAVLTPVNERFEVDVTPIPKLAARLHEWGVSNIVVGGTMGESLSFSYEERMECVVAWLAIAP